MIKFNILYYNNIIVIGIIQNQFEEIMAKTSSSDEIRSNYNNPF